MTLRVAKTSLVLAVAVFHSLVVPNNLCLQLQLPVRTPCADDEHHLFR
jgi:hypothetical protein